MEDDWSMPEKVMPEDDRAYDGSSEPQKRELTARERDILYRILRDIFYNTRKVTIPDMPPFLAVGYEATIAVYPLELPMLRGVMEAIDPRDDR